MMQKIENALLAILRMFAILVSTILLLGFLISGLSALQLLKPEPGENPSSITVSPEKLKGSVVQKVRRASPSEPYSPTTTTEPSHDTNSEAYQRAARAIGAFVEKASEGSTRLNHDQIVDLIRSRATQYNSSELVSDYARSLAESMETVFETQEILTLTKRMDAVEVVDVLLTNFDKLFDEEIKVAHAMLEEQRQRYATEKSDAMQSLYMASGTFVAFLMAIFLSIFIRVERSLRNLERIQ